MVLKSKNALTNTLLRLENFLSASEQSDEETSKKLLDTIDEEIENILYPLRASGMHLEDGAVYLNKGYLRQTVRPSADGDGKKVDDAENLMLDGRRHRFVVNFLEKYLQTGNPDYKGYNDPSMTSECRVIIISKITSFFKRQLWKNPMLDAEEAKRHICNRFGIFFWVMKGFVIHESFFNLQ